MSRSPWDFTIFAVPSRDPKLRRVAGSDRHLVEVPELKLPLPNHVQESRKLAPNLPVNAVQFRQRDLAATRTV